MKNLKRVFCLLLCVFSVFVFSACGSNDNNDNAEMRNPSENHSNELSISGVLNAVYTEIEKQVKNEYDEKENFSSIKVNEYSFYNDYVKDGLMMIKTIADSQTIILDKWIESDETSIEVETGEPNSLYLLYISREKVNYQNNIKIYMFFTKKGYDFAENDKYYTLFAYDIIYDENSKKLEFDLKIEDSRKNSGRADSNADYYIFSYISSAKAVSATSFRRLREFDYETTSGMSQIPTNIFSYNNIVFGCEFNNLIAPQNPVSDLSLSKQEVQENIQTYLKEFAQVKERMLNLDKQKVRVDGLSNIYVELANITLNSIA